MHNWATVAAALAILMGSYAPFAVWYGFTTISMNFPVVFMLGFRAQYSFQYPLFTRKGCALAHCWMIFTLTLNAAGQIYMTVNSLVYHLNESIPVSMILVLWIGIFVWFYDDIRMLRKLKEFSKMEYEEADFLWTSMDSGVVGSVPVVTKICQTRTCQTV